MNVEGDTMQSVNTDPKANAAIDTAQASISILSALRYSRALSPVRRVYVFFSQRLRLAASCFYDWHRYATYSFALRTPVSRKQLQARLTMQYHAIEKGLALSVPRVGFGASRVEAFVANLRDYVARFGHDETVRICVNVLRAYRDFNRPHGFSLRAVEEILAGLSGADRACNVTVEGGIHTVEKTDLQARAKMSFEYLARSRHSIRHFSSEHVDLSVIENAIRVAQKTPSVCNRQSCRVHVFSHPEQMAQVFRHQNGNRGFGHQASKLLIVTSDLRCFSSPGERFQSWIDGGMFAMTLIYALHTAGLGSCALNWSATYDRDKAMRREANIPDHEVVMMMIAVGHLPSELRVTHSPTRPLGDVMVCHEHGGSSAASRT